MQLNLSNIPRVRPAQLTTVGQRLIQQIGEHIQIAQTQDANWLFGGTLTIRSESGVVYAEGTLEQDSTPIDPVDSTPDYDLGAYAVAVASGGRVTVLAFRRRFTTPERVAIDLASIDDPNGTQEQRALAAAVRVSQADLSVAKFVDLQDPETRSGVNMLESVGLIGAGRASEILDTPVIEAELP